MRYAARHLPDGETRGVTVFLCRVRDGDAAPRPDLAEVSECRYWPPGALPRPISDFTMRRIQEAVAGVKFRLPSRIGPRVWLE